MNKAVVLSVHPSTICEISKGYCDCIVVTTQPRADIPFKMYIYETNVRYIKERNGAVTKYAYGSGKVIGECFVGSISIVYGNGPLPVYLLHVEDIVWYKTQIDIRLFERFDYPIRLRRPPVTWCYVKENEYGKKAK